MLKIEDNGRKIIAGNSLRMLQEKFTPEIAAKKTLEIYKKIMAAAN